MADLMRKFFLFLAMVLSCPSAFALDSFCYQLADYQEKMQCVDAYVQALKKTDSKETLKSHANIQALVGFFAYIFKHYPEKKAKLLEVDPPQQHVKSVYVESLYRAGLPEEAKNYARTNGFDYLIKHFSAKPAAKVDIAIPQIPSDNDLLIGAYMASGDKNYIAHLFEPLKQVDDGMAKDAIRMGFCKRNSARHLLLKAENRD